MFTVLVTGFGPFGEHTVNASWEVAKYLKSLSWDDYEIRLVTEEIPVAYDYVLNKIPLLWKEIQPQLVVHMGVAALYKDIQIETQARKSGYKREDIHGNLPTDEYCAETTDCVCIQSLLDIKEICAELKKCNNSIKAPTVGVSKNAGNYLCEFIYYNSLSIDPSRVIFVHVPDINNPYSVEEMGEKVKEIIVLLTKKLKGQQQNTQLQNL